MGVTRISPSQDRYHSLRTLGGGTSRCGRQCLMERAGVWQQFVRYCASVVSKMVDSREGDNDSDGSRAKTCRSSSEVVMLARIFGRKDRRLTNKDDPKVRLWVVG